MRMTIEKALEWAYREELPRVAPDPMDHAPGIASASGPMADFCANPSEAINAPLNRWGVIGVRDLFGRGPHPDAVQIGLAVQALCAEAVTMAGDPPVDGPHGALWAEAYRRAALRLPRRLRDVIIRRALAGDARPWDEVPIEAVPERYDNGRDRWFRMVERKDALGLTERAEMLFDVAKAPGRRPARDCYRKFRLVPDPAWMIEARATYTAWRAALDVLHEDLAGRMGALVLLPSEAEWEPWNKKAA